MPTVSPVAAAHANSPDNSDRPLSVGDFSTSASTLLKLFVLAALLESAMAIVFNWRPFLMLFDGRGMKTPCMLLMALLMVYWLNVDVVQTLAAQYKFPAMDPQDKWFADLLTAMVIAGGSAGVNKLLVALGYRTVLKVDDIKPRPAPTTAWISVAWVKDKSRQGIDTVNVEITNGSAFAVVGLLNHSSSRNPLMRLFVRDFGRFPHSGGWEVPVNVPLSICLVAANDPTKTSAPWSGTLSPGAMVDIELRL
ncbi:hypothetical protein [Pseudomonas sp. NPDC086278]|uniref:hypothetical protein n=1 Tax=Pseudomonas sp. NPDC086278 TaxID=3390646 RepID=UPI003D065D90